MVCNSQPWPTEHGGRRDRQCECSPAHNVNTHCVARQNCPVMLMTNKLTFEHTDFETDAFSVTSDPQRVCPDKLAQKGFWDESKKCRKK